ncbi:MAG: molybdenum ABC transporter, periplasmic molybdate-binding protein, partial [Halanaerobium sp.]
MLKKRLPRVICIIVILIIGFTIELTAASTYRIMAASSLQEPLNEIKEKYEQEYRDYELEINYAGSQVLFSQIKMGVDFDLFLSANHDYLKQLKKEDRIKAETIFTKNELLIIINSQKNRVDNLEDLMSRGYSLLIGVESVPVGSYTIKMIDNYVNSISKKAKKDKFKSDFNSLVVSREFDVKSVLN